MSQSAPPKVAAVNVEAFIARWAAAKPSERANSQQFLGELCALLHLPSPDPKHDSGYAFEFQVTEHHGDGSTSPGWIDLYKRGCFVLESKQYQDAQPEVSQLELAAEEMEAVPKRKKSGAP